MTKKIEYHIKNDVQIVVPCDREFKRQAKRYCFERDMTMADFVRGLINEAMSQVDARYL